MHLTPDQLVDVADGTQPESSAPHLTECDACRQQLIDLRAMMAAATDVDVPEPSPLFWDHLSSRVAEAVSAEPARTGWNWWLRIATPFALATAAALAIAFFATTRLLAPRTIDSPSGVTFVAERPPLPSETLAPEVTDPSLLMMADLAGNIDFDSAREAGLASRGSAEHAVTHMTEGELQQLHDLLQHELNKSSN